MPILLGLAVFIIQPLVVLAQEGKTSKVTVTITENDKIITDTTFAIREGQDPEAVKEIISHVLSGEVDFTSKGPGLKEIIWVSPENDEHVWYAKDFHFDIDSISEEDEDVMIFKDESDNIHTVVVKKRTGEGEDIFVTKSKTVRVSEEKDKGYSTVIIKESGDEDKEGKAKRVKVIVESDDDVEIISEDDLERIEEDEENVDVYVIKKDDGTKVIKKVKVEVKEVEEEEKTPAPTKEKDKKK